MSEPNINGRKRLIVILIAAAVALAVILGVCLYFALGGQSSTEPTEPKPTTGGNTFVPDPTDPTEEPLEMLFHCICGSKTEAHLEGCDGSEHPWKAWTATDSLPTVSGKYYLTADVNLVPVADITTGETIYLDLNGFNINSPTRVYRMAINETEVSLTILDSVGTSVVTLTEHANAASFVLLSGTGNKTFTLYGGTIDGSALKADPTDKNGGVIRAGTTPCTVNIHGGTVIGAATAKFGGTIYVENGTLNMTGGELKNGHALNGGNLFAKDATVAISGGKISGGVAEGAENSRGGNIFNNNAKITIAGTAEIFDGKATYLGSNVFSVAGSSVDNSGKIYMTDGSDAGIYPVPDEPEDANHVSCICGSKTATHLAGCDGTKYAWRPWKQGTTLPSTSGRYYLTSDVKIDLTVVVSSAADIYLDLNGKTITATNRVYLLNAAKTDISMTVLDSVGGGKVVMSDYAEGATFAAIGNTGNKVLTINGGTFDASKISADKANGGIIRVGSETSTLNLNAGTMIGAAKVNNGGAIHINGGAMNMNGGEIKDGHANNGGNVFLNGGSFTMTGGKVSGGVAEGAENSRGGNIFNNVANVTISGTAEVLNGTAVLGNNVFNSADSKYTNTGKVTLANGDPGVYPVVIAPLDTNHMACVCGSKTDKHLAGCDGEKVAWRPWDSTVSLPTISGRFYLTADVTLENIQTIEADANVFIDLNGKTINRGTADRIFNLTLTDKTSKLTVTDSVGTGKIELTDSEAIGALVLLNSGDKEFTMYGGAVNGEKIATKGNGAVIRNVNQKVNIHGGTIIGGKAIGDGNTSGNGGAVYNGGTMTVTGGHIKGGIAVNGGVIYNAGKLEITKDAKIGDGTASNLGHNICNAASSTFANEGEVYLTAHENAFGIYPARVACVCGSKTEFHLPGCDGTKVNWSEWTDAETLPCKSGYYFLTENVKLKDIQVIGIDADVYIDLNGMTVDRGTADRVFNQILTDKNNSLTILDSVGTGKIELGEKKATGALVLLNTGEKTFTMYGGTVNGAAITGSTGSGLIIRSIGQNVNIHGGTIIGAKTVGDGEASGVGGTIWNSGKLNITAGKITGGSAVNGGNIYNCGELNISAAAQIVDGFATTRGHNIFNTDDSTFTNAGKVYLTNNENAIGIYPAYKACVCGSKTETHLPGCDGTEVNWSEWTKTDSLPVKTGNYFLTQDVTLKAINLIETDAAIALDLNGMKVTLDNENAESASLRVYNIITNNTTVNLTVLDSVGTGVVDLGTATSMGAFAIIHEAQDATDVAPDGVKTVTIYGGKFDGSKAVICDNGNGGIVIRNVNQTLNIHGGEFIGGTADTSYAKGEDDEDVIDKTTFGGTLWSGGVLNITDGKIYGGSAYKGGNIYINAGVFTMSGGEIYGGKVINQGGNVYVNSGSVEISGGEIHDGTASENSGGNIYIKAAEFTMTDGKVYKGIAQNGGNIFVTEGGSVTMSGGSVYEGTATASNGRGGNIFSTATGALTITAGDIYDGVAPAYGANIFCAEGSSFEIAGNVYFTGETGDYRGVYPARIGCICGSATDDHLAGCNGDQKFWREWNDGTKLPNTTGYWILTCDVNVSNVTKIGNKANVYIDLNGKTVYRDGASRIFGLNDNNVSAAGGDFLSLTILDSNDNGTFELDNGAETGTFLLLNAGTNKTFTMYGGTINGADVSLADNHGAVIRNIGHTVNIHGGTINGGRITTDSKFGGAIHSTGALNITGGTISGGRAASYGGNIFVAGGSFSMTGGSVLDGTAGTHGANICISAVNAGDFELGENAVVGFTDPALADKTGISAKYTIAHKQQNLADDNYGDYVAPISVYGTVNTLTEATANTYAGFTAKEIQQQLIAADCSTVVEVLYDRNTYSITWVADGNTVKSETLKFGAAIVAPADPEKAGFRFEGWDVTVPATMPAQDLTITAILVSEASHTVTFNSNGGTAVGNQAVVNGTVITKPADPTRIYSTFAGWYSDSALTTEWNFDTPVSGDTTLYAKWADAVSWTEWNDSTKLPDGSDGAEYYRLKTGITVSTTINLNAATNIVIDLNNQTVTSSIEGAAVYYFASGAGTEVTLSIWDSGENGKVVLNNSRFADIEKSDSLGRKGTYRLNIYGGTIEGGTYSAANGGVISLSGTGNSVYMFGGTIKGANVGTKNGGAAVVNNDATFNMMGGKIYGGQAQNGGNFIIYGGRLIVTGGEICEGVATGANNSRGGNIFCNAAVIISGGSIYDGTANTNDANAQYRASGNIFVGSGKYLLSATNPNVAFDTTVVSNVYFTTDGEKDTTKGNGIFKA